MKSIILLGVVLLGVVLLLISSSDAGKSQNGKKLHPVILVPGLGGSRLLAKLHGKESSGVLCSENSNEFTLWLKVESVLKLLKYSKPFFGQCVVDNMKLIYDNVTRTTSSVQGVNVRAPNLGDPSSVETLYPDTIINKGIDIFSTLFFPERRPMHNLKYFRTITNALKKMGLKRNVDIIGAPYDFRKAPNEHKEFFLNFKKLVKKTYRRNGNTPVVLLAHSMGGPMTLHFLHQQTQEWKDKYIKSFVSLAASWGGSLKAIKIFIEGDDLDLPFLFSAEEFKQFMTTMPSVAWMLPFRQLWGKDEILVSTPNRNYTVHNMSELFDDLGQPTAREMYNDVLNYTTDIGAPGVEVHCLYGTNQPTIEQLRYDEDLSENMDLSYEPNHKKELGDGTVNLRSLEVCRGWNKTQTNKVHICPLNLKHMDILRDEEVVKYIEKVVSGENIRECEL